MFDLFYMGGPIFMGLLSFIFIAVLVVAVVNGLPVLNGKVADPEEAVRRVSYIRQVGLLALVVGVLGQLIGLYEAFRAIEIVRDVSPALLIGGLKVSMITTLYGIFIYIMSLLIALGISTQIGKAKEG
jgi:flagellar motor component MotA